MKKIVVRIMKSKRFNDYCSNVLRMYGYNYGMMAA